MPCILRIHFNVHFMQRLLLLTIIALAMGVSDTAHAESELSRRVAIWEAAAFKCGVGDQSFPSKPRDTSEQPCDDGDMTLFNGLLCAAGDERGCRAVAASQDPVTGLWHRSPRIRQLGKNDQGNADFSPDMALGVQLYLVRTRDVERAAKWLKWIDDNTPCSIKNPFTGGCWVRLLPKFCSHPDCVIRPQDYAALSATVSYLQQKAGLKDLPDGPLRGNLGTFSSYAEVAEYAAAHVNDQGFPQHLVATTILLLRGITGDSWYLRDASREMVKKNPGNAFFSYLAEGPTDRVRQEILDRCTADPSSLRRPLRQWQWERANEDKAWEQSCLWDCIFITKLVQ